MDRESKIDELKRGKFIGFWDIFIICALMAVSATIFFSVLMGREDGGYAQIYVDGELVEVSPLDRDCTYECKSEYGYNLIEISGGKLSVIEADCPDKVCSAYGKISRDGDTIYCLPNRLQISITSEKEGVGD